MAAQKCQQMRLINEDFSRGSVCLVCTDSAIQTAQFQWNNAKTATTALPWTAAALAPPSAVAGRTLSVSSNRGREHVGALSSCADNGRRAIDVERLRTFTQLRPCVFWLAILKKKKENSNGTQKLKRISHFERGVASGIVLFGRERRSIMARTCCLDNTFAGEPAAAEVGLPSK